MQSRNFWKYWYWGRNNVWFITQADHIRTKPNGDKKETSPTISTYCRTFFIVSVLLKRQKRGTKRHGWVSKSYPLPPKTIRGYDCRKMAYFWRDLSILYLSHLQWLKLVLQSKKSEIMKNEKSTFSVLFYLKKDKMKKNGLVPIHARITINGKQTQFNTKLEV